MYNLLNIDTDHWLKDRLNDPALTFEKVMSADHNEVYRIISSSGKYFLKRGIGLKAEYDRLIWLEDKLPVPKVVGWHQVDGEVDELLTTAIEGQNLAELAHQVDKDDFVLWLAKALHQIHSLDTTDCSFGEKKEGYIFTHGDACLPNFIFQGGKLTGLIDLGDSGINDPKVDLAAAVWSLDFNLGKGLGASFLKAYGVATPTEKYAEELADWYYEKRTDEIHSYNNQG